MFTLPHGLIKTPNPIFKYQVRRVGRLWKLNSLRLYSRLMVGGAVTVMMLWWVWLLLIDLRNTNPGKFGYVGSTFSGWMSVTVILLLIIGAGLSLIANVWYARTSSVCINTQVRAGQWDLVRLTPMRDEKILLGTYAVAQVQAWRMLMVEIAVRIAPLVLLTIEVFLPSRWLLSTLTHQEYTLDYLQYSPFGGLRYVPGPTLATFAIVVAAALVYLIEPLWRMRAVVAVGMAVSSRVQNEGAATGVSILSLLGMHLVQAVLAGFATYIAIVVSSAMSNAYRFDGARWIYDVQLFVQPILVIGFGILLTYVFYRVVAAGAYHYALARAFQSE